ncbi:MAG: hypothetical protein DWQ37_19310 [Planctomycetota bacterium]|nr:MAG: hypothetical protein DWQ37_19310 [Planctomycetota bacterium]
MKAILVAFACLVLSQPAAAVTPADEQPNLTARGDRYHAATAKTHSMHARDHARLLNKYAAAADAPVSSSVLKKHLAAIRENMKEAGSTYSKLSAASKSDPSVKQQLDEITKRLDNVNKLVGQLEERSKQEAVDSKLVIDQTNDMAKEIKASHAANSAVDQAVVEAAQRRSQFYNPKSPNYYFTGEGHFID